MALNIRQEKFVLEYLKDGNATRAATAAGYSAKTAHVQGCNLLKHPNVAEALLRARETVAEEAVAAAVISVEWVLKGLKDNFERAMQHVPVMEWSSDKHTMVETGEYTYQGSVANKALELVGRHLSMFDRALTLDEIRGCTLEEKKQIAQGVLPPRLKLMA